MSRKSKKRSNEKAPPPRKLKSRTTGLVAAVLILAVLGGFWFRSREGGEQAGASDTPVIALEVGYEVVNKFPHDPGAFLQGLVWQNGFFESTGQFGRSSLRRVEYPTGKVLQQVNLDSQYFGWGLTYDGKSLILSDGTNVLTFIDPDSFKPTRKLSVRFNGTALRDLNELEYIDGEIWANVWHTDRIVRIDPGSGQVKSYLNLAGILPEDEKSDPEAVLNGIAYDAQGKRIFVSGKLWPRIFEIRLK